MKVSETSFQVDFLKPRTVPTTHMAGTVRTYPPSKSPSPVTPLGAGRVDPFLNSAVEIRPYMNLLIDHCKLPQHSGLQLSLSYPPKYSKN